MKLKHALITSGVWTVVGLVACVALIAVIASRGGRTAQQQAQTAGAGAGVAMAVGYGVIWLPYAAMVGRRMREAAAKAKRRRRADD